MEFLVSNGKLFFMPSLPTGHRLLYSMVYMSRMPVGGKGGQSRLGKRSGEGPKRSTGTDRSNDPSQGLEVERKFCDKGIVAFQLREYGMMMRCRNIVFFKNQCDGTQYTNA